ncbi:MAG: MFS transporter [Myxococcales bacterium]|nr:MFS transporter [Myxococcales bacterium]
MFASLFALAADIVPASRRIEGIGLFGVSGLLPVAVSGIVGDGLVGLGGYPLVLAAGAATAGASLLLSLLVPEPPRAVGAAPRGLWAAAREPHLFALWVAGLLFATAISAYFILLKTFVEHHPIGKIGDFFGVYAVVASALRVGLGSLPERLGPKRVAAFAMTAVACGLFLLASADARWHLFLAGGLAGAGHGYTFPILLGLVVTRARATERGAALTLFTALFDGGTVVGGFVFGWLAEHAGYPPMFATAGVLALVGLVLLLALDRRHGREAGPRRPGGPVPDERPG